MILYLHGFRSSPQSWKARLIGERMAALGRAAEYRSPQLPASPAGAIALAMEIADGQKAAELTLIGSSLGGFYATWLAEKLGCKAVLLNPAVSAPRDLQKHVGVSTAYHSDQPFEFTAAHARELPAFAVDRISRPERYFLIAATGDEVLDWREMTAHYPDARQLVIQGSDHGLSDFESCLDEVLAFAGVPGAPA